MGKLLLGYGAEILNMGKKIYPFLETSKINTMMWPDYREEGVRVCEHYHEEAMKTIGDYIAQNKEVKIIQIAGPSSSGKTTLGTNIFNKLKRDGFNPIMMSLDDYYRGREYCPVDEFGEYDYEAPEAVDLELFNQHIWELTHGKKVEIPRFEFEKAARAEKGVVVDGSKSMAFIVEGIHALNPIIAESCTDISRIGIFINAMGQVMDHGELLLDAPDLRLIRRMVRDNFYRAADAFETISRWPSVRRGEENHIFPYANSAQITFNTWLPYESCVLKTYFDDIIEAVSNYKSFESEAHRLIHAMSYFNPVDKSIIPKESLLNEFVK